MQYLETIYSVLIILRMYCIGLAFIAYCKYQGKNGVNVLAGAIIYSFCGFSLYAGIRHPYFSNATILLPLNFIAIEKLLRENKKSFLIFIVFITAISNYYFFYMITIMNAIYYIIKYIFEYNTGLKEFFKKSFTIIKCYIIGILMASIILLPTVYALLNSARVEEQQIYAYSSGFYKYLFMGIICMRFSHWAVISVSSIVLLFIPVLFTKLKEKESKTYATLFIVTTIMLIFPFIASLMNGFSFPSNRWVFAYSFILSYIVTICFQTKLQYSKKQIIIMFVSIIIYSIIGIWLTKLKIKQNLDFYACLAIAMFILIVIGISNIKEKRKKIFLLIYKYNRIITIFFIICNIGVISLALYSTKGKGYVTEFLDNNSITTSTDTLSGKMDEFKEAIEYIKQNDKGFYRIAKCDSSHQNISLVYDYQSIQTYVSLGNKHVYNLSSSIEDNYFTATRCINGMDRRTKITTLLGTKYYICRNKDSNYLPYGYTLYKQIGDTSIYINTNNISVGIVYDNYILKEEYDKLTPLQKEDLILTTAVLEEKTDKVKKNESEYIDEPTTINYMDTKKVINNNKIQIEKKNQSIYLQLDEVKENEELYLSIKNLKYESKNNKSNFKITTYFNGIKNSEDVQDRIASAYYKENPDFLINLGIVRENTKNELKITFNNIGTYTFDSLEILSVSMDSYEKEIEEIKNNEMTNVIYKDNFIGGHISSDTNGILQLATSYSDGWKAYIDGKETPIVKVNEGFVGVFIEEGEHEVEFHYETPYIKLGVILSTIGSAYFIFVFTKEKINS